MPRHCQQYIYSFSYVLLLSSSIAYAQTPDLSDPPEIEGAVVGDHGKVTIRMGLGLSKPRLNTFLAVILRTFSTSAAKGASALTCSLTASSAMTCR